ncbi:beta strand repeat-containing protein [Hymenobacter rubidus]|uniref:beta strand repeat-containing protein n=1 Tax=Hymenobacter rubidus TaxID=1441626 RepID=UPI00191DC1AC|nr:T9SS type A sorting domain-containing protein [Hymenobacter rubidus]
MTGSSTGTYGTSSTPLQVSNASTNASTRNVAVYGNVLATEPTVQPGVSVTNVVVAQADVTVSGGNGAYQLVVIRPTSAIAVAPVDGTSYTANTAYGSGTAVGTNNFVVFAGTTGTNTFTVTGLTGNTSYTLTTYAFNGNGGVENYYSNAPGTAIFTTLPVPAATYTWSGLGLDNNWTTALNWLPLRAVASTADVLVFDGSTVASPTVNVNIAAAGETVSQLLFRNNVTATLTVPASRTLTIDGNAAGDDFVVEAGSRATLGATVASTGLTVSLTASTTASIAGTLVFDGNASFAGQHSLQAGATNAVQFVSGGIFRTTAFYSQSGSVKPFGTTTASSVIFRSGSRFEQYAGSQPFGGTTTVLTFETGGRFVYAQAGGTSVAPSVSNRTYGTLEFNTSDLTLVGNLTGASPLTTLGDLIISQSVGLNLNGGVRVGGSIQVNGTSALTIAPTAPASGNTYTIKGDLLVNNSASFSFDPGATAPLQFNGTTAQVIGGSAPITALVFGINASLAINNAAGVTLQRPITLQKVLTLTSGKLTTSATNLLTLSETASTTGGSATSFVNGPLARITPGNITTATPYVFPVGKLTYYRPFTLTLASQNTASTYTVEQVEGNPNPAGASNLDATNGLGTAPLKRVSRFRSFTLASTNNTTNNAAGTVTLSFGTGDGVNNPNDLGLVVAVSALGSPFNNLDRSASSGPSTGFGGPDVTGTLTSKPINTFSAVPSATFALGATNENVTFGAAVNPLPVELTSFTAQRQAETTVALNWTTASEKNAATFDVQRSFNGVEFATVASVAAQGNSTRTSAYAALDKTAPASMVYYRLRQVDRDGTIAYSPIATVAGNGTIAGKVLLYPNPARSSIAFLIDAVTPYRVLNLLGQAVLQGTTEAGTAKVAIERLAPGLYFLELQTTAGRAVQKFEKE